jgi:hypothetical protein
MKLLALGGIFGFVIGLLVSAEAARVDGDGALNGWSVEVGGRIICTSPAVFTDQQTIWCPQPPDELYPPRLR